MDWCVAIRRIAASSAAIQSTDEGADDMLKTLLGFLDHEDVLVSYAAKEELWKILISDRIGRVNKLVKVLLVPPPTAWRRESGGFRFQLLRQLIKTKNGAVAGEDGSENGSSDEEEEHPVEYSYLHEILKNLQQMRAMVRGVFVPAECMLTTSSHSIQLEALVFMSDFVKRLHGLNITKSASEKELSELMIGLMEDVFVTMDYSSQPTFVSSAVLSLLGDFQELMTYWNHQTQVDTDNHLEVVYLKWLEWCLVWLKQSSCVSTALQLFNDIESLSMASQKAFVASVSQYSFLQQWLLYLSRVGVAFIEASLTQTKRPDRETLKVPALMTSWTQQKLPTRQQLFTVLAEQDDVMIEVLNGLTQMASLVSDADDTLTHRHSSFITPLTTDYDPDLLFADLVDTLGRDHLVLLDLLTSNETQMLEYLMRYLRHFSTHWNTSKRKLQTEDRLEGVMSVLIRLRLEIDRLVGADLFPYGAGPLTRRLLAVEQLYEELGHEDAEQL
ncbi:Lines family protein [Phytophthora infestans]|nr:Lines family protein [Phytophthora infestans]